MVICKMIKIILILVMMVGMPVIKGWAATTDLTTGVERIFYIPAYNPTNENPADPTSYGSYQVDEILGLINTGDVDGLVDFITNHSAVVAAYKTAPGVIAALDAYFGSTNWRADYLTQQQADGLYAATAHDHTGIYESQLVCEDGQIKKWSTGTWICAADDSGEGGSSITIGTANGLSLSGQELSLSPATNETPGASTAAQVTLIESALQSEDVGAAAYLGITPVIGNPVIYVDDGEGNPAVQLDALTAADIGYTDGSISITSIDLPTGADYRVDGVALDVGDLTDSGNLLGVGSVAIADIVGWPVGVSAAEVSNLEGSIGNIQDQIDSISVGAPITTAPDYKDTPCTPGQYAYSANGLIKYDCVASDTWMTSTLSDTLNMTPTPAVLVVTPTSHDFGEVSETATQEFVVTNIGESDLVMQATAYELVGDEEFSVTSNNCNDAVIVTYTDGIAANESCAIEGTFTGSSASGVTYLFNEDFESGLQGDWSAVQDSYVQYNHTPAIDGDYSLRVTSNDGQTRSTTSASFAAAEALKMYVKFNLRVVNATPTGVSPIIQINDVGGQSGWLNQLSTGGVRIGAGTGSGPTLIETPNTEIFYTIWLVIDTNYNSEGRNSISAWYAEGKDAAFPATSALTSTATTGTANFISSVSPAAAYSGQYIYDNIQFSVADFFGAEGNY